MSLKSRSDHFKKNTHIDNMLYEILLINTQLQSIFEKLKELMEKKTQKKIKKLKIQKFNSIIILRFYYLKALIS